MLADSQAVAPAEDCAVSWWRGAAIYQIYPRSFADSDGDGVGDLPGITEKLDYVASLGVDGIWLSPFFTSPMHDFGYDVSDYCDVDPVFGTLADFDALVGRAHELGLKVIIDQVYSHSSIDHPWFAESRTDRVNAKADWYVWADAKADGSPPTNWQSVFGGPAWTWDARRGQYYLHNFLAQQPDLNLHNPEVQNAILRVARFWLDRDVDGFRIDAINFAMHDPQLRDNPPAKHGHKRNRPFDFQQHLYNQSHPDIVKLIGQIRSVADVYGAKFTLAEVGGDHAISEMRAFTQGEKRFNSAYGFEFLYAGRLTPMLVADAVEQWPDGAGSGWPTWAFENHDAPRAISRWCDPEVCDDFARLKILLLVSLRGSIILYQGEELGLPQVDVPFDLLQDPEAIANWPATLSRDGARTPMPWVADAQYAGFSVSEPWLPVDQGHRALAVDRQEGSAKSVLGFTRACLKFRAGSPALRDGAIKVVQADEQLLVFERSSGSSRLRCSFNLSDRAIANHSTGQPLMTVGPQTPVELGPYAARIEDIG
ncbi:MAG: DUF3459 domain-containing protein [Sphingomonas sp.]|nr:DUF3459 domain-containing protein [Sphingomonas sp.]